MNDAAQSWIEHARRDLLTAEKLKSEEYLANISLFHSQQAVEKIFKAAMEEYKMNVPRIHSILTLKERLPEEIKNSIIVDDDELNLIDDVYIDSRYPNELGLLPDGFPTSEQAEKVYNIAENIFNQVHQILSRA